MFPTGSSSPWARLRWLFILLAGVVAYGVVGYMSIEGWSFADALYMTVTTLTTVGFREIRPLDGSGRAFTISLIVLGVGLVFLAVSLVAGVIAEGDLGKPSRRRRMQRRIDAMRDHFIVCAYGRVGRPVARGLEEAGMPFVVIDRLEELEERMAADGVAYIIDDPSLEPVLRAAGVERARGLVCAVDSDASNVYITLMARSLNPDLFIVARASEPGSKSRLLEAGADRVVSPFVESGRHMALMALRPDFLDVLEVPSRGLTSLELEEMAVEEGSPLAGGTVSTAAERGAILAVRRPNGDVVPNPPGDLALAPGDLILLLGGEEAAGTSRRATQHTSLP